MEPTGEYLAGGGVVEAVARFVCPKDGRVYVRLKEPGGWACTRSRKNFLKVVLTPVGNEAPLEPAKCREPYDSVAMRFLPHIDPETMEVVGGSSPSRPRAVASSGGVAAGSPPGQPGASAASPAASAAGISPARRGRPAAATGADAVAAPGEEAEAEEEEMKEEEEDAEEDDAEPVMANDAEGNEDDFEAMEDEAADDSGGTALQGDESESEMVEEEEGAEPGEGKSRHRYVKRFRVVVGRCPVLETPSAAALMSSTQQQFLTMKTEFLADAVLFVPAEQRAYLRLTRGRGWVSERSRTDMRRFAVLQARKKAVSQKQARMIAFRGGDADGFTRLRKDDLVKNSQGRIVSKKASEAARKRYQDGIGKWTSAVKRAREELGLEGFVAVKKGTAVYEKAQEYYKLKL